MPGSEFVPQHVWLPPVPHNLSWRQQSPPPPPAGRMNLPPSERYPSGQQVATPGANPTVRSGGQHVYLFRREAGTVPDASAVSAQISPFLQQIGLPLPGDVSHARVPFGQHFAIPPIPAHVSLLLQQVSIIGSQHVLRF